MNTPSASDRVPPQQALQQARAAWIAGEVPREPEASIEFKSAKHLREHVVKHVFDAIEGPWWHRVIGRDLVRQALDAPELGHGRPVHDPESSATPAEVSAARKAFRSVTQAYQTLLSDRLVALCREGRRHIHLLRLDYDEAWQIAGSWQKVVAWDADGNLVMIAGSSVTPSKAREYILQTGHRRHPDISRGQFLKDTRRWALEQARERRLAVLAIHDGSASGTDPQTGSGTE